MAKLTVFCLFAFILCVDFVFSSNNESPDYFKYSFPGASLLSSQVSLNIRKQRDVASSNNAAADSSTDPTLDKETTIFPKKEVVDKFPDTKLPYSEVTKPSKYDKYGKGEKKPLGKPGEKPPIKPDDDQSANLTADASVVPSPTVGSVTSAVASTPVTAQTSAAAAVVSGASSSAPALNLTDDLAKDDDTPLLMDGYVTNNTAAPDHHRYYNSFAFSGQEVKDHLWVNLEKLENASESDLLSSAHRQAFTLMLPFSFPFYGHVLNNITIATGGFLYTGDLVHTWLAATQYIAPLMANFDTSASDDSKVKYVKNETALTVQWENVKLKERLDGGSFTFQVTIHASGDIVFSYKDVPIPVDQIADDQHPVKVGLSDAYIVHKTIFYVRRKTIYEYHKIDMKKPEKISNWTAIVFKALPTCVSFHDCYSCVTQNSTFQCRWCEKVGRCSDGMDRHRQDWLLSRCDFFNSEHPELCSPQRAVVSPSEVQAAPPSTQAITTTPDEDVKATAASTADKLEAKMVTDGGEEEQPGSGVGTGVTVAILVCLLVCIVGWLVYAYFYPHTASGQLLIKYRPSTWSFKRGGARYTAASMHSIHM